MLDVFYTKQFKKDFKKLKKTRDIFPLLKVIDLPRHEEVLPKSYKDHALVPLKDYANHRECQIKPDWLLIYQIDKDGIVLTLSRTGSHSELF